ncbi:MAG TPA: tetratricopeptide repeat protein [Rhizomicrobium sp.]|nr:tetratricopeptide repeat protein [Rhizomicrobium sp.]
MTGTPIDPAETLRQLGQAGEGPHDIAAAALMLAALDHAGLPLAPYEAHLAEIAELARQETRSARSAEDGARALSAMLFGRFGYDGDRLTYDDPRNADLIAVIDRRRGMPVTLGILHLHAARAAGFEACGLNSPGHFLLRIETRGGNALIDPFNGGAGAERERFGTPPALGAPSPDDPRIVEPVSDIEVLLRLQNNLKVRALNGGDRPRALEVAKRMVLIAPKKPELWIDLARLNEGAGALGAATRAYEACLGLVKPGAALHNEAALGLLALKRRLH